MVGKVEGLAGTRTRMGLIAAVVGCMAFGYAAQAAEATGGKVVIKKQVDGPSGTSFEFSSHTLGSLSVRGQQWEAYDHVAAGMHTITEAATPGWTLKDASCDGYGSTASVPDRSVTVKVKPGKTVTCTFKNQASGYIKVVKDLTPDSDTGRFDLYVDDVRHRLNAGDNEGTEYVEVKPGIHTVSEEAGTGTSLTNYDSSVECKTTTRDVDPPGTSLTFDVMPGEYWDCVISNKRKPDTVSPPAPAPLSGSSPASPPAATPGAPAPPATSSTTGQPSQIAVQPTTASNAKPKTGSAKLAGPERCETGDVVSATVSGRNIGRVTYYLDGRLVRRVNRPDGRGRWVLNAALRNLGFGPHKLRARVVFVRGTTTKPRTIAMTFRRCAPANATPSFTG